MKQAKLHQWIITHDLVHALSEEGNQGTCGPRAFESGVPMIHEFRMRDDDFNCYYIGLSSHRDVFAPLDDFGKPNAGCTSIEYRNNEGYWAIL